MMEKPDLSTSSNDIERRLTEGGGGRHSADRALYDDVDTRPGQTKQQTPNDSSTSTNRSITKGDTGSAVMVNEVHPTGVLAATTTFHVNSELPIERKEFAANGTTLSKQVLYDSGGRREKSLAYYPDGKSVSMVCQFFKASDGTPMSQLARTAVTEFPQCETRYSELGQLRSQRTYDRPDRNSPFTETSFQADGKTPSYRLRFDPAGITVRTTYGSDGRQTNQQIEDRSNPVPPKPLLELLRKKR